MRSTSVVGESAIRVPWGFAATKFCELAGVVESFAVAVAWAREAGVDGVQVHTTRVYLPSEFRRVLVSRWGVLPM